MVEAHRYPDQVQRDATAAVLHLVDQEMRLYNKEDKDGTDIEEVVTDVERESPSADRNSKKSIPVVCRYGLSSILYNQSMS